MRVEIGESSYNIAYGTILIGKYGKYMVVNSHENGKLAVVDLKTFSYGVYSNFNDFTFEEEITTFIPHERVCLKVTDQF